MAAYRGYLRGLVAAKTIDRNDDFASALLEIHDEDPEQLTHEEIASILFSLSFAGHETTNNLIGNAIRRLLEEPERWDAVVADPTLIPGVVDEVLRYDPSVVVWRRQAKRDVTVGGVAVPAGAKLFLWLAATGRDPSVFPDPNASIRSGTTRSGHSRSARASTSASARPSGSSRQRWRSSCWRSDTPVSGSCPARRSPSIPTSRSAARSSSSSWRRRHRERVPRGRCRLARPPGGAGRGTRGLPRGKARRAGVSAGPGRRGRRRVAPPGRGRPRRRHGRGDAPEHLLRVLRVGARRAQPAPRLDGRVPRQAARGHHVRDDPVHGHREDQTPQVPRRGRAAVREGAVDAPGESHAAEPDDDPRLLERAFPRRVSRSVRARGGRAPRPCADG